MSGRLTLWESLLCCILLFDEWLLIIAKQIDYLIVTFIFIFLHGTQHGGWYTFEILYSMIKVTHELVEEELGILIDIWLYVRDILLNFLIHRDKGFSLLTYIFVSKLITCPLLLR